MNTGPTVSVAGVTIAIPNWNHEYVLPRSINSALRALKALQKQGVPGEVLVVDDQSRDGSLVLLRQLEALHFADGLRVIAREQNGGLPVARNHALREARYRFIVFMDADNELLPDNIHQFYRAITQTQAAVVYGNLLRRGDAPGFATLMSNESFQGRMFQDNYIDAFALFDAVQVREMGGYMESAQVRAREDWELYLHLASNGRRIVFVPLVFGTYHAMPGSMIKEAIETHAAQQAYMQRVFDQLGIRQRLLLNSRHLRYHPDIGYL
jgi:succinoglycan biosynthesis protein ExoO